MSQSSRPDLKKLKKIAFGAMAVALLGGFPFWQQLDNGDIGWIGLLICGTLTVIIYGAAFYIGCLLFENTLEQYIESDTFKRKNKWVDVETKTRPSDDTAIDTWVTHYVFARTMLAIGILPLLACIYLFFIA